MYIFDLSQDKKINYIAKELFKEYDPLCLTAWFIKINEMLRAMPSSTILS